MLVLLFACVGVFGDRQGAQYNLDVAIVIRHFKGGRGGVEYIQDLKAQLLKQSRYPFYTCTDDAKGDLRPMVTERTIKLLHTPDSALPSTWGDSPEHRRWKLALTLDLFGCLLSAHARLNTKVIVYMEDDVLIKRGFDDALSAFAADDDDIRWGWPETGALCIMLKRSVIPRMYALSESRWMHDPADWIILETMKPRIRLNVVSHQGRKSTAHWKKG